MEEEIRLTRDELVKSIAEVGATLATDSKFNSDPIGMLMVVAVSCAIKHELVKKLFGDENEQKGQA